MIQKFRLDESVKLRELKGGWQASEFRGMFIKTIRADKRPPSLSEMRNMEKERIAQEKRLQETEARINIAFGTVAEEYSTEFSEVYSPKRPFRLP